MTPLVTMRISDGNGVVAVRQIAHRAAELAGLDRQDQTRFATAVSEIARNAFEYARGGRARFAIDLDADPQMLLVTVSDDGPGIADLAAIEEGRYVSRTGLGVGLMGARRLVERFDVQTDPTGTHVTIGKRLSRRGPALGGAALETMVAALTREAGASDPLTTLAEQNRELVESLNEVRARQDEMAELNRELEDTNRGVVALYAELDERAEELRRASELKSRFLSNMSHEFRTPLNSIIALTGLLLDGTDGTLTPEQARQVGYIAKSAHNLTELVNDLLDLAKVEAGKLDLKVAEFTVGELFSGLRGALRPLLNGSDVDLIFDEPPFDVPLLRTDEGKVGQILRNLVSNALKFTSRGEVRVSARYVPSDRMTVIAVADTGIGIAPEHHEHIFEEFTQVDNDMQRSVKGTGLGLPLSRRLAELMGGRLTLDSEPGRGSTFELHLPVAVAESGHADVARHILVADDDPTYRYVLRQMLRSDDGPEIEEVGDGAQALAAIRARRPDVLLLDLEMPVLDGYRVLEALAASPDMSDLPVVIVTSAALSTEDRERLASAVAVISKGKLDRSVLRSVLGRCKGGKGA